VHKTPQSTCPLRCALDFGYPPFSPFNARVREAEVVRR
jgi:hypothetical protein